MGVQGATLHPALFQGMDISKLDKSRHRNLYGQLSFFSVR